MSLSATRIISAINECVSLFLSAKSAISSLRSRWSGSQEQSLHDRVLQLQSDLQRLCDTLPAMYHLINGAEWRSYEDHVAKLLPSLKDAVSEAEDLIDEFRWHEMKVQVEGNAIQSPFNDFLDKVIHGNFNKLNDVQLRLNYLSSEMKAMGLRKVTHRFAKSVRPVTTSLLSKETKIFGREKELKQVLGFLNVPTRPKRKRATSSISASTSTSSSNHVNAEPKISSLPVLVVAGIGGVGKTTLAQHICNHQRVKSHFELIIRICVSHDFNEKRLTKEVIESSTGKGAKIDHLDSLQRALYNHVKNKRLLIVLDDVWDDALKDNGRCWEMFCAPFTSVQEGSAMLVTTRCPNVTKAVHTMEPVIVEGLKDDVFWNFFKLCAFGSEGSSNDPELECIGRRILPKLKGSPLAAKTLGRMLSMDLQASHWSSILESELWELKQKETEILPALRLSYMYLPFYLKQCFAFCALYPKDYKFEKACLAEIWVAEGFVEPQGGVPIQDICYQYFEDLVSRSFFQKVNGRYVIHDLLHDMAQKVSEHDCFILRNKSDFDKVPQNVRHLYILPSSEFDDSNLLRLCKYTKLRTLICKINLGKGTCFVMDHWCTKLTRMRVMSCAFTNELPDSIGNWKHLRYLEISGTCNLKRIPSSFCWLYNMQILYAKKCKIQSLPTDFDKLTSLQKIGSNGLTIDAANQEGLGIMSIKNLNQIREYLVINNLGILSEDHAAEAKLKDKKCLERLILNMRVALRSAEFYIHNNDTEVLEGLQPPISLKGLFVKNYVGVSLPSWFQPQNLPSLTSLGFEGFVGMKSISFPMISQTINLNETHAIGTFLSLTNITIEKCENLSSLEDFLQPSYLPGIKNIEIKDCKMLASVPTEFFGGFHFLEELRIADCPNILNWQRGLVLPSHIKVEIAGCPKLEEVERMELTERKLLHFESRGSTASVGAPATGGQRRMTNGAASRRWPVARQGCAEA
ncbi:putative disease resistance RPP13-like protein 1 [Triticum dicoccoides]|uniref:putative disease resistance RPP13-like protein 1 n=1 Tax=Triticum dicoccoides TaxID=85692 RepID=UPI0018903346|nr:putative disease resistance RPP13-like protein 1 [Triticum dicoccoides]